MRYACAKFQHKSDSLALAQRQRLDEICKKLMLKPGDRMLEVGCSWGTLAMHAAQYYGARVHGITTDKEQWMWANAQVTARGLTGRVFIELRSFKDIKGEALYDKVCNVDLFEHIKPNHLSGYLKKVNQLLKPGGQVLQQFMTQGTTGTANRLSSEFIHRYVSPPSEIMTTQELEKLVIATCFDIQNKDDISNDYATTLRRWVGRLEEKHLEVLKFVSEPNYRIWRLFMSANALEFESGHLCLNQILMQRLSSTLED
jgi:cyclopropane-fatty-acyl-phospholipid synthase